MNKIILPSFELDKFDIRKREHLELVKKFDRDESVKKYLFPYKDSFYDLITNSVNGDEIFNNFYVINYENRIIGYIEIENKKKTFLNSAIFYNERKKGYSTLLLKEISDYLLINYPEDVDSVNVIFRTSNSGSVSVLKNSDFQKVENNDVNFETYTKGR